MSPDTLVQALPAADPLPLAAPSELFHGLLVLTSILHLLAMNLLFGGTVLALAAWRHGERARSAAHVELARRIARALTVAFAATVTLGVAPLLFLQVLFGRVFYVSSILIGWWWLAVVPVVIAAYYSAYVIAAGRGGKRALAFISVALLAVSAIVSSNMSLMLAPGEFAARYAADPAGLRLDVLGVTAVARWLHIVCGAVAIASLALAVWGTRRRSHEPELARAAAGLGLAGFTRATAFAVVGGAIWFGTLPQSVVRAFTGGDAAATLLFALAVGSGGTALGVGIVTPRGGDRPRAVAALGAIALVTVVLMVLVRDRLRAAMLAGSGLTAPAAAPQWSVIAIFAVCLIGGAATVAWMLRVYARAGSRMAHGSPAAAGR